MSDIYDFPQSGVRVRVRLETPIADRLERDRLARQVLDQEPDPVQVVECKIYTDDFLPPLFLDARVEPAIGRNRLEIQNSVAHPLKQPRFPECPKVGTRFVPPVKHHKSVRFSKK